MARRKTAKATVKTRRPLTKIAAARKVPAVAAGAAVLVWEDDPFSLGATVVERPTPNVSTGRLKAKIAGYQPAAARYDKDTAEFRYWTATEALERALEFWGDLLPTSARFRPTGSDTLPVTLDVGSDLNAYYYPDRGLEFHHAAVGGRTIYSGESPDIVLHETGHAVLDSLRPELFDAMSIEAAAFHEAFGDISAILVGLQLPSLRASVLAETGGTLYRTSRLSRLAESLGWGIRQSRPDRVPPDCLRNAVNSWLYRDPRWLPSDGPDSELTAAPHSFARVFTGGFFEAVSGMFATEGSDSPTLQKIAVLAGRMIVAAVRDAPVVSAYFSSIADALIDAAPDKHRGSVVTAMVRRGLVPVSMLGGAEPPPVARGAAGVVPPSGGGTESRQLIGARFGLPGVHLGVRAPVSAGPRHPGASPPAAGFASLPQATSPEMDDAVLFTEMLFRRGRIRTDEVAIPQFFHNRFAHKTHALVKSDHHLECRRIAFDCGFAD